MKSKLEELIEKLCPNGVEYKKFEDICRYIRGITYNKLQETTDVINSIKVLRANNITLSSNSLNFEDIKLVSKDVKINENQRFQIGDILICAGSGSKEHIGKIAYISEKIDYTFGGFMAVIRCNKEVLNSRFLFHIIAGSSFSQYLKKVLNSSTINNLSNGVIKNFLIPIPPIEVQEEIARILDELTEATTKLITELTTELTLRKQQYEHYRDELLTFGDEVEWKSLGEIGELVRGNGLPKTDFTEVGIPAIHYGQIYTYYGTSTFFTKSFVSEATAKKLKKVNCGDVVITNTSENLRDVGKALLYLGEKQAVTGGHATIFKPSNLILGKFFVYISQSQVFTNQKSKYAKGTKVIDVSASDMSKFKIPVPPLEEQQRIVDILDRFDKLVNDIKEGLPAEIEMRQKQYEYYRDKLLNFKKLSVEG